MLRCSNSATLHRYRHSHAPRKLFYSTKHHGPDTTTAVAEAWQVVAPVVQVARSVPAAVDDSGNSCYPRCYSLDSSYSRWDRMIHRVARNRRETTRASTDELGSFVSVQRGTSLDSPEGCVPVDKNIEKTLKFLKIVLKILIYLILVCS